MKSPKKPLPYCPFVEAVKEGAGRRAAVVRPPQPPAPWWEPECTLRSSDCSPLRRVATIPHQRPSASRP